MNFNKNLIIACRADGFGERMLALLNAMYIANRLNIEFKFVWNALTNNNKKDDRFVDSTNVPSENVIFSSHFINKYSCTRNMNVRAIDGIGLFLRNGRYKLDKLFDYESGYDFGYVSTQYDLSKICEDVEREEYYTSIKNIWDQIHFSEKLQEIINLVKTYNDDYIAVHIRSGEALYEYNRRDIYFFKNKILDVNLALEVINSESLNKNNKIIIFSDDLDAKQHIKDFFKDRNNIFTVEDFKIYEDVFSQTFFELLLMSRSKKIYSSGSSGFSQLACRISNRTDFISIYDLYTKQEQYDIIRSYVDKVNFNNYSKAFSYFKLYLLSDCLKLSNYLQKKYLFKAMKLDPVCNVYIILFIYLLARDEKMLDLDLFFKKMFFQKKDVLIEDFLFINVYDYSFLYSFVFEEIFKNIKDTDKFLNIRYLFYRLYLRIKENENIKKFDQQMMQFLDDNFNRHSFNPFAPKNNKIYNVSAVKRTKEHLCYKMGYITIQLYRTKIIFLIPFAHIMVFINFIINKIIYKCVKKYDPSLTFPPLRDCYDYQEALKVKEYLSYKLGKALVRAHKNWYKGGYIKLIFDIIKLKKEFKGKGKK
ncbi:hypothetical protein H2278_03920 [Campylobacter sp. W0018]|uniref:hypothetical protein n=1 Tax=Campylobacter sp. W0018 TaxID=2735782 RepID=UPI00301BA7A5|nr:hypothetical protein [Campylobacter sp. W0018]